MLSTCDYGLTSLDAFRGMYFEYIKSDLPPVVHVRKWDRKNFHYDNCFVAMLTLFAVQTSEGWVA